MKAIALEFVLTAVLALMVIGVLAALSGQGPEWGVLWAALLIRALIVLGRGLGKKR